MENVFRFILIIIEVVCCLLLIGVILLQQSKSQGLGMAFGGGMSETLFGSRAGNVMTKITIILSIVFLANTTLLGIMFTSSDERSLVEKASAPAPLPVAPVAPTGNDMMSPPSQPQGTLFPTENAPPRFEPEVMPVSVTEEPVAPVVENTAVEEAAPVVEPVATP